MKPTKRSTITIVLMAAAILLSLYLYGTSRKALHQQQAQATAWQAEAEQARQAKQQLALRQQADETFIQGDYDKAESLYTQAGLPDEFILARQQRAGNLQQADDSLRIAYTRLNELQELISRNENRQPIQVQPDSAARRLKQQRASLQQALTQQRITIDSLQLLVAKHKNEQRVLEFVNEKGNRVYYLGEQQNGKAHGQGVGLWETGGLYTGQWRNNQRHGEGIYQWADGERYEGSFNAGMREGHGTYYFNNNERYEGNWKADKRSGEGTIYGKNGKVKFQGIWENDELKNGSSRASS